MLLQKISPFDIKLIVVYLKQLNPLEVCFIKLEAKNKSCTINGAKNSDQMKLSRPTSSTNHQSSNKSNCGKV